MQTQNFNPQGQTQMGQAAQQQRMTEPPQIITTKDLAYIKDGMSWLLDIIKKDNHFAKEAQDQKVQAQLKKIAQIHQKHYNLLLKHLNPQNTAKKLQS